MVRPSAVSANQVNIGQSDNRGKSSNGFISYATGLGISAHNLNYECQSGTMDSSLLERLRPCRRSVEPLGLPALSAGCYEPAYGRSIHLRGRLTLL
jgi:hypothetical protein